MVEERSLAAAWPKKKKKAKLVKSESRMVVTRGWELGGSGIREMLFKGTNLQKHRKISFGDLTHSIVIQPTILYYKSKVAESSVLSTFHKKEIR